MKLIDRLENASLFDIICYSACFIFAIQLFWAAIGDRLIGYTSPHIDFGKQKFIPEKYSGEWCGEFACLYIEENAIEFIPVGSSLPSEYCEASRITIDYGYDYVYNTYKRKIIMNTLPRTLFGNQQLHVSCDSEKMDNINHFIMMEPLPNDFDYQLCLQARVITNKSFDERSVFHDSEVCR